MKANEYINVVGIVDSAKEDFCFSPVLEKMYLLHSYSQLRSKPLDDDSFVTERFVYSPVLVQANHGWSEFANIVTWLY
ncbi:hypothetical protein D3C76_1625000 [compost metagenome]